VRDYARFTSVTEKSDAESESVSANGRCNVSMARGASNGAGEAAYLIRNKYSCHIPGAGWCQVFDCYPTPHVRERPSEAGTYLPRVSKKFETISNGFFHPTRNPFPFRPLVGDLPCDIETKIIRSRCRSAPSSGRAGHIFKVHSRGLVFHVNIYSKVTVVSSSFLDAECKSYAEIEICRLTSVSGYYRRSSSQPASH